MSIIAILFGYLKNRFNIHRNIRKKNDLNIKSGSLYIFENQKILCGCTKLIHRKTEFEVLNESTIQ